MKIKLTKQVRSALNDFVAIWYDNAIINEAKLQTALKNAWYPRLNSMDLTLSDFCDNMTPGEKFRGSEMRIYASDLEINDV